MGGMAVLLFLGKKYQCPVLSCVWSTFPRLLPPVSVCDVLTVPFLKSKDVLVGTPRDVLLFTVRGGARISRAEK